MPSTRVYSLRQTADELWKGAELKCGGRVSHDMNLFRSYAPFCYRPLPLPHPLFARWPEQLISCPLAHDQLYTLNLVQVCESIWKSCTFLQKATPITASSFSQLA